MRKVLAVAALLLPAAALDAQSEEFGKWKALFNGKDTSGWQKAKPSQPGETLRWAAEDGTLTNTHSGGEGQDLSTSEEFKDYELELEYRIPKGGNSGVYLRGVIEVQIYDSHGKEKLTSADAGAVYGGNYVALRNAQKPAGEWNKYRVLHIGHHITVWHNDVLIQDNIHVDRPTGGAMTHFSGRALDVRSGPIMFQGDHSKVWYRNIRIRPLFSPEEGWRPLWNGKDLSELTARRRNDELRWTVEDRAFTNTATGGGGHDIWTRESFGNFLVHYAYKSDPTKDGGNSGFYLRDQWEIQIYKQSSLTNKHADGSLYSLYSPLVLARHGPEEWNHMDIKVEGQKIWVWQNGKLIHDGRVCETRTDNHSVPTLKFSKGPFKFQGDHGKVWFTDLYIKPLPDTAIE
jgi:hypothetical protein